MEDLNLVLIIAGVVLLVNVIAGSKKGLIKTLISLISGIITCIVVVIIASAFFSYNDREIVGVIIMVILLGVVGIVRHLLGIVFFSAKVVSALPIVSWADKLLGMVFGVLETVILVWTLFIFNEVLSLGEVGTIITDNIESSKILTWLAENNYLADLVEQIGILK